MHEPKIDKVQFYGEYHGHIIPHLKLLYPRLRSSSDSLIWTAGDSSLDNKYWFRTEKDAVGEYANILSPPKSKCDVTFWLNYLADERRQRDGGVGDDDYQLKLAAINTAVEATTLNERTRTLRPQDVFLRDNIQSHDTLIVSIGGNDVALYPTPCTIGAMMGGLFCVPKGCLERGKTFCVLPVDDCCCGCGPSFLSCAGGCPPCLGYFRHLFGMRVQKYIEKLCAKTTPKKILICMIYYPAEELTNSWANRSLNALGYNSNPTKLQAVIKKSFEEATSNIHIKGSEVIPVPLYHVLDGKTKEDYVARVEPSALGGKKMADYLLDIVQNKSMGGGYYSAAEVEAAAAPMTSLISDR